jgi:hypothetical protein
MATIATRYDTERGCGWRQPSGLYLVADGPNTPCGRMFLSLTVCKSCGQGLKPSRGFTWVTIPEAVLHEEPQVCGERHCAACPLCPTRAQERVGLLWCGEAFYPTPQDWIREAHEQGVSRRIPALPKGLVLGETWVLMAHRKAIMGVGKAGEVVYTPGIIQAFRPTAAEYVVTGKESEEELDAMVKRGITPIRVERVEEQPALL